MTKKEDWDAFFQELEKCIDNKLFDENSAALLYQNKKNIYYSY